MKKFIITAELRDITDPYYRDEISYTKMVDLLNEKAEMWVKPLKDQIAEQNKYIDKIDELARKSRERKIH